MKRQDLYDALVATEARITSWRQLVDRRLARIMELERSGSDVSGAKALLAHFRELLHRDVEQRARILIQLGELDVGTDPSGMGDR
ncbi:hypothetical protein CH341_30475 [Rhodoplanes roseus]|uniref:Uncharacterized protein n=1 Tax=Rhodoplanes roseus TaxID=29409 RepID=A0A327KBS1_9BRAD|nr:hypothetical protein CH341_30475 [Rhodoplanes roseus]